MKVFENSGHMAHLEVRTFVAAPPEAVWDVIADGWTYSQWVVGNSRMRAVDPAWPAPGTAFYHRVGLGPLTIEPPFRDKGIGKAMMDAPDPQIPPGLRESTATARFTAWS